MGAQYNQLTEHEINSIVWAIKRWPITEDFEWEPLRTSLKLLLPDREKIPTRANLRRKPAIKRAFTDRKREIRESKTGKHGDKSPELRKALDKIVQLEHQVEELQEQINREAYNIYLGRDKATPIKKPDRDASKSEPGRV